MQWFKHSSCAHNDAKLEKVLMKYGADGYGLYWYCLELIAGKISSKDITFKLEHDAEILGYRLKIDSLRVEEIMRYCITLGLFEESSGTITCLKLAKSLDERWTRSEDLKSVIKMSSDSLQTVATRLDKNRIDKIREDKKEEARGETPAESPPRKSCPYNEILNLYHTTLPELPAVVRLTDKRKRALKARWGNGMYGLDNWKSYFEDIRGSKFLMGKVDPWGGRKQFIADFDFLIRESTTVKTQEGKYH